MSNTMSDLSIEFFLIRKDGGADDRVFIRKNLSTNEYCITYTDPNEGGPKQVHVMTGMYYQKVLDYVYYLLKNQCLDEEGFEQMQVNIPGMPRVIVSIESMRDVYYRSHFYELVGFGLEALETTTSVVPTPKPVSLHNHSCARAAGSNYPATHLYFGDD